MTNQPKHHCASICPSCHAVVIKTILHEFAESLGAAVDAKDPHTRQHSEEVAAVAYVLSLQMGLSPAKADVIHVAGHLHDVGKIGIPDSILKKPGPLNAEEWDAMRQHPAMGVEIVRPVRALRESGVLEMIRHHHERYDGRGYPDGLQGTDIPLGARIIAVADSISAMLQKRPYREAGTFEAMAAEIVKQSGTQFDPNVVAAFQDACHTIRQMTNFTKSPAEMAHFEASKSGLSLEMATCLKTGTDNMGR